MIGYVETRGNMEGDDFERLPFGYFFFLQLLYGVHGSYIGSQLVKQLRCSEYKEALIAEYKLVRFGANQRSWCMDCLLTLTTYTASCTFVNNISVPFTCHSATK